MTDSSPPDGSTRRSLLVATSAVGAVGAVAAAAPFVVSLLPSERAKAAGAPVEVDVSHIAPGAMGIVEWRGKPVWIVHRTQEMLDRLEKSAAPLADPESSADMQPKYAQNPARAREQHKAFLVVEGVCTHLGCSPTFRPEPAAADLGTDWPGGFYCPCHGSKFDLAARVYSGVPAPLNLRVPPHQYVSENLLVIGTDEETKGA